jgi:hypothetical protein
MSRKDNDDVEVVPENEAPEKETDILGKDAGSEDVEAKGKDEAVPARCFLVFRVLRSGGVLTVLAAVVLPFVRCADQWLVWGISPGI